MLLKYTGGRSTNKVSFQRKLYIFNQVSGYICDVPDRLARLLIPNGSFIPVDNQPVKTIEKKEVESDGGSSKQENINPLQCNVCGFVAKSEFGLLVHKKRHSREEK